MIQTGGSLIQTQQEGRFPKQVKAGKNNWPRRCPPWSRGPQVRGQWVGAWEIQDWLPVIPSRRLERSRGRGRTGISQLNLSNVISSCTSVFQPSHLNALEWTRSQVSMCLGRMKMVGTTEWDPLFTIAQSVSAVPRKWCTYYFQSCRECVLYAVFNPRGLKLDGSSSARLQICLFFSVRGNQ